MELRVTIFEIQHFSSGFKKWGVLTKNFTILPEFSFYNVITRSHRSFDVTTHNSTTWFVK